MFTGRWAAGSSIRSQVSCAFHFLLSFRFFVQLVCVGRCLDTMPQKHGNGLKFTVEMLLKVWGIHQSLGFLRTSHVS
jgi:hypothetical protein